MNAPAWAIARPTATSVTPPRVRGVPPAQAPRLAAAAPMGAARPPYGGGLRWPGMLAVVVVHAIVVFALLSMVPVARVVGLQQPLMASLIAPPAPQAELEKPRPLPPRPRVEPPPTPLPPPPVLSAPQTAPAPVVTAPPPEPTPVVLPTPAPAPEPPAAAVAPLSLSAPPAPRVEPVVPPVVPPRFDADYLDNPAPVYPALSRRLGEQGRVLLRVHVLADGSASHVEVRESSGFERLDRAARETVARWRFVPARQGEQPVAAWVLVPISFSLRS